MFSKKGPSFQKVAVSDSDEHRDAVRKKCWTPEAIRPPLLIILLCFVLTLIALLQVASSKSVDTAHITSPTKSAVQKRQLIVSTRTYSGFQETITATTITWQPSTYTYSSGKITYSPTTQTISGTTESLPGYTSYIYETFLTSFGTIRTQLYEVITSAGDTSTEYVNFPSAMTSAAYLDTATGNTPSTLAAPEATPPNAYLQETGSSSSQTAPLITSPPATSSSISTPTSTVSTSSTSGFQQSTTATTITWQPSTYTYSSGKTTYPPTTQTISGTTESLPGYTSYIYETFLTSFGTTRTQLYEVITSEGDTSTESVTFPSAMTSAAYPGTATSNTPSTSASSEATPPNAYLQETGSSSSQTAPPITSPPATSSSTSTPICTASTPSTSGFVLPELDRIVQVHYSVVIYYVATYLPSILIILLKIFWSPVFASTKLIEPFRQLLTCTDGANVSSSILADYLSPSLTLSSPSSLLGISRLEILLATATSTLITVLAPLAAESMAIRGSEKCITDGLLVSCAPVWTLAMIPVRILQGLLALVFVLIMAYTLLSIRRRNTGLYSDPSSIATISSLLGDQNFTDEVRALPIDASKKKIKKILSGNRYALTAIATPEGDTAYEQHQLIFKTNNFYGLHKPSSGNKAGLFPPKLHQQRTRIFFTNDFPPLILSLTILGLVLAYALDYNHDSFNNFFSSDTFGPRFLLSSLATILDNRFRNVEREVRVLHPWRTMLSASTSSHSRLHGDHSISLKSHEPKINLTSQSLPLTPYTAFPIHVSRMGFFPALVSLTSILGDILIIAVVGVPYSDAEIYTAYRWSVWFSVAVLALMIIVTLAVATVWRSGNQGVESSGWRMPDTVLGVARRVLEIRDGTGMEADGEGEDMPMGRLFQVPKTA
ncbi:hypothetical protein LTR96_011226 [Exophiala xenobiotica]|nr:hypothetical protein LTR41_011636 [Exophiala xenobiotica]KAK5263376.1 hypothetical protein LTR96_011226 [Exophiala xenobiotica]KAK5332651.1 hypothetical protein LTR98_011212 [Exophiala xenobiotica]KAK5550482.1 hypothetical protein LTR46_011518 [Exophiala xenobiotica]